MVILRACPGGASTPKLAPGALSIWRFFLFARQRIDFSWVHSTPENPDDVRDAQ
jgi:hypothetical protein